MAPVPQEAEIVELNWEQLEGIQGGGWFKKAKKIVKNFLKPKNDPNGGLSKSSLPPIKFVF
jgi:hypothetical protein